MCTWDPGEETQERAGGGGGGGCHSTARHRRNTARQWPEGATYIFSRVIRLPLNVGGGGRGERRR